jgi:hypothetical protein
MDREGEKSLVVEILVGILLVLGIMVFGLGYAVGWTSGKNKTQSESESVSHGFGEWVPDKHGDTTFRWKVVEPAKSGKATGFYNPATAEDYEHMHDYLQPQTKPLK